MATKGPLFTKGASPCILREYNARRALVLAGANHLDHEVTEQAYLMARTQGEEKLRKERATLPDDDPRAKMIDLLLTEDPERFPGTYPGPEDRTAHRIISCNVDPNDPAAVARVIERGKVVLAASMDDGKPVFISPNGSTEPNRDAHQHALLHESPYARKPSCL